MPSTPISPPPETGRGERELPAYVSNGLIGLRVRDVPLTAGMAVVSGFAGEHPERHIEAIAAAPYPLAGDLAVNAVWLSDQPHQVQDLEQSYDFATGELVEPVLLCFLWRDGGVRNSHVREPRGSHPGMPGSST